MQATGERVAGAMHADIATAIVVAADMEGFAPGVERHSDVPRR
jgi:hypothetical protein